MAKWSPKFFLLEISVRRGRNITLIIMNSYHENTVFFKNRTLFLPGGCLIAVKTIEEPSPGRPKDGLSRVIEVVLIRRTDSFET